MIQTMRWIFIAAALIALPGQVQALSADDARHLLVRTGFAAPVDEVEAISGLSRAQAVSHILAKAGTEAGSAPPDFVGEPWVDRRTVRRMSPLSPVLQRHENPQTTVAGLEDHAVHLLKVCCERLVIEVEHRLPVKFGDEKAFYLGPVWGIQRNYKSGIHLGLSLGAGFITGANTNFDFHGVGSFELGFIISTKTISERR